MVSEYILLLLSIAMDCRKRPRSEINEGDEVNVKRRLLQLTLPERPSCHCLKRPRPEADESEDVRTKQRRTLDAKDIYNITTDHCNPTAISTSPSSGPVNVLLGKRQDNVLRSHTNAEDVACLLTDAANATSAVLRVDNPPEVVDVFASHDVASTDNHGSFTGYLLDKTFTWEDPLGLNSLCEADAKCTESSPTLHPVTKPTLNAEPQYASTSDGPETTHKNQPNLAGLQDVLPNDKPQNPRIGTPIPEENTSNNADVSSVPPCKPLVGQVRGMVWKEGVGFVSRPLEEPLYKKVLGNILRRHGVHPNLPRWQQIDILIAQGNINQNEADSYWDVGFSDDEDFYEDESDGSDQEFPDGDESASDSEDEGDV